jgi:uncharacterized repeat protein (TIGR01451 family)
MNRLKNLIAASGLAILMLALLVFLVTSVDVQGASAGEGRNESAAGQVPGTFLTGPNEGEALDIALDYIANQAASLGLSPADVANLAVTDSYVSKHTDTTHIYLVQTFGGIRVFNGVLNVNIASDGSIINIGNRAVANLSDGINSTNYTLLPGDAVDAALAHLGLSLSEPLNVIESADGYVLLSDGGVSQNAIPVQLVYQPVQEGVVRLAWELVIYELDGQNWWDIRVDAVTGRILGQDNFIDHDFWGHTEGQTGHAGESMNNVQVSASVVPSSYLVYAMPVESPNYAVPAPPADARTTEISPWLDAPTASPMGWHANTVTSWTNTQGNNVDSHKIAIRFDCGATLECDPPLDLTMDPTIPTNVDAATVNLFYWNNIIHDVTYEYGFDEAAGNFQNDNFGLGGLGNDRVNANAQAPGNCNANFATNADGIPPTMNMFICNIATPSRDGDLDNGVIAHEYGHGISNRLTGGPGNVNCLNNSEQMGEGWSDWLGLILTIEPGDAGTDSRGIGTWLLGEGPNGPGVRPTPYSTDMSINPTTYGDIGGLAVPHGVGYAWAGMVWEVVWNLIDEHGYNADFYADWSTGGNNLAFQLVMDGMKLQPCSPGFVDGRDAILLADQNLTGGANQCLIWEGFAKRGLGFSASQGSSSSTSDGTEAFDLPPVCLLYLLMEKSASSDLVNPGENITYTLRVTNNTTGTLTNLVISDTVPMSTTYVPGSASDGGSEAGGVVTWPTIASLLTGDVVTRTFEVMVSSTASSTLHFFDDFEGGFGNWTMGGLWNAEAQTDNCGSQHSPFPSPSNAAYYGQNSNCTYNNGATNVGFLTMNSPINLSGATEASLSVWSFELTENFGGYDTRSIQASTDGANWSDVAVLTTEGSWYEVAVNLSSYTGGNLWLRFEFDSVDSQFNDFFGWLVDDVSVLEETIIENTACVSAAEGDNDCDTVLTTVGGGAPPPTAPQIDVAPGSLSSTQPADTQMVEVMTIGNLGNANLNWTVDESNTGNCQAIADIPWASASPTAGTTAPAGSDDVDVTFDSTGLAPGVYTAALCVASDDTQNPLVTVPLTLTVEGGASITLEKTVGLDPNTCAATDSINVPAGGGGTAVTYCYTVTNTGDITFTTHDLVDDQLGVILSGFPYNLGPGNSAYLTQTVNITQTTVNSATWTASVVGGPSASASDSATVTQNTPTGVSLSDFGGNSPVGMLPMLVGAVLAAVFLAAAWQLRARRQEA